MASYPEQQQQQQSYPGQPTHPGQQPVYHPQAQGYGPQAHGYGPQAQAQAPAYQAQAPMMPAQQHPPPPPGTSDWNSGLCGCCSPISTCFLACCLPCIVHGKTADRMRDPTMKTAETFNNDCLISLVLNCAVGCGWIWTMQQRGKIRQQYGIKGSTTNDCCISYWCPCCATVQNDKEVVSRTKGLVTNEYQAQSSMQVKPQQ